MGKTVLCFGDSNTHGTKPMASLADRHRWGPEERWPGVLSAELGTDWTVIAEGNPGRTTVYRDPISGDHRSGLLVLPSMLESHEPVDIVILKLGTNDMQHRFAAQAIDVARAVDRLIMTVLQCENGPSFGTPQILLVAPPPVREDASLGEIFAGAAAKSERVGAYLGAIAARREIAFLDAGDIITVSPIDGVHYDAEAHAVLGRAIAEAVRGMA